MVGKSLSHYEIIEPLGSGGMGEVYRAHDTSLNRDVAIKVLPEDLADDPDRLARLKREAHLLAALNHPNVATIHGFEESDGTRFLVMELVKGESLEQRLAGGRLPVDEALDICRQIAEALESAHEEGIIHRDLKPANVLITPDGRAKVLDFGLAKTVERATSDTDLSHSPTLTIAGTQAGVILGTAPYMSPEQVRGKPLDRRADIWAFGCVLYETLTGSRAFNRETVADTLAAILEVDPPWEALPAATPVAIQSLLRRCLRKDPRRRLHDIADARIEIEEADEPGAGVAPGQTMPDDAGAATGWTRATRAVAVAVAAVAMVVGGLAVWNFGGGEPPAPRVLAQIELPEALRRANTGLSSHVAVSPDGRHLVANVGFDSGNYLVHRRLDQGLFRRISGSEGGSRPFFSPDSQWVGFSVAGDIKMVSIGGGTPRDICADCSGVATWSPLDDTIVFAGRDGRLLRVPAEGGSPEPVEAPDGGEFGYGRPSFLPDGKAMLLEIRRGPGHADYAIGALNLMTGTLAVLADVGSDPAYAESGHVVYLRDGSLYALPFDYGRLEVLGEPALVLEDLAAAMGAAQFSLSRSGLLAYAPSTGGEGLRPDLTLVWVDREGNESPFDDRVDNRFLKFSFSPDGKRLAASIGGDIWIYEIDTDSWQSLTSGRGYDNLPVWTKDGSRIIYARGQSPEWNYDVYAIPADFSGEPELLYDQEFSLLPWWISPAGDIVVHESHVSEQRNIMVLPGDGGPAQYVVQTTFHESEAAVSPNGRWIAYVSNLSGQNDVYVEPFPSGGQRTRVSDAGGARPTWGLDGDELFFRNGAQMIAVPVNTSEPAFSHGERELLFERDEYTLDYDVHRDGRFLMTRSDATEVPADQIELLRRHINIDTNWFEELKRLAPTGR